MNPPIFTNSSGSSVGLLEEGKKRRIFQIEVQRGTKPYLNQRVYTCESSYQNHKTAL